MRYEKSIVEGKKRGRLLMVCVVAILCLNVAALAQSGRRQSRNPSAPATVVTENKIESEPQPKPPAKKSAPAATAIVGGDRLGTSFYVLPGYVSVAVAACVDRLRKYAELEAVDGGNMTRRMAIDRAKKEKDAHVIWLEIKAEENGSRAREVGSDEISIGYTVFMPQTAKVLTSGRVYLGSRRVGTGGVGIGVPSITGRFPLEYQLKEAGENVADRVKNKLPLSKTD